MHEKFRKKIHKSNLNNWLHLHSYHGVTSVYKHHYCTHKCFQPSYWRYSTTVFHWNTSLWLVESLILISVLEVICLYICYCKHRHLGYTFPLQCGS